MLKSSFCKEDDDERIWIASCCTDEPEANGVYKKEDRVRYVLLKKGICFNIVKSG